MGLNLTFTNVEEFGKITVGHDRAAATEFGQMADEFDVRAAPGGNAMRSANSEILVNRRYRSTVSRLSTT